jgi:hypothetical protein
VTPFASRNLGSAPISSSNDILPSSFSSIHFMILSSFSL